METRCHWRRSGLAGGLVTRTHVCRLVEIQPQKAWKRCTAKKLPKLAPFLFGVENRDDYIQKK